MREHDGILFQLDLICRFQRLLVSFIGDFSLRQYNTASKSVGTLCSFLLPLVNQPLSCTSKVIFVDVQGLPTLVDREVTAEAIA